MRCARAVITLGALTMCAFSCAKKFEYPATRHEDVVDDYHGVKVTDPFRWLEDDNAEETLKWVEAQNKVTFAYLEQIPARERIRNRLTELWNFEKYSLPFKEGGRYFYFKNDGLQNQSVLYVQESLEGEPRTLLDPNTLSEDGTVALSSMDVSKNGKHMAYGLSSAGSDWQEFHVRGIEDGRDLEDHLRWVKFSGASWTADSRGFYYSRYPEPVEGQEKTEQNRNQKVYYHKLGTPQDQDLLIFEDPAHPDRGFGAYVTEDGQFVVIHVWEGTDERNRVYYMRTGGDRKTPVVKLLDDFDASYSAIDNDGDLFYFRTDLDAPRYRVIAIDLRNPRKSEWREIIPQSDDVLSSVSVINNQFVAVYMHDAHQLIKIFDKKGAFLRDVPLPAIGSVAGISGKKEDAEMFYGFTSFSYPVSAYRYDFTSGNSTLFRAPKVLFNPEEYVTEQVFYKSKDGTRIPMFIAYKKGMKRNGNAPATLYGYGGFNISMTPGFSISTLFWMESGGIYAMPNLRGGGEYGKEWHEQGMLANKQNVFDDFIAAAEYLIAEKYTSSKKLAISGGSNGGLLVGACMTQRPDLFAVALPAVGVMDMLRYHEFTIGWGWASDFGRSDNPDQFKTLYAYSPYHNLKEGVSYPATLVTTADHDDRVVPAHSFKFAARLQETQTGKAPVLIRIETRAGHGAGKPTAKAIEEAADKWAFVMKNLGMKY